MKETIADPELLTGCVLVVDDDEDCRRLLARMLERRGHVVVTADSGRSALEAIAAGGIDVIMLDVMMPAMDGFDVCRELARNPENAAVPIILLTARDDLETRAAGMKLGVSDFLTKPINKDELFTRVRTQLEARRLDAQLDRASRRIEQIA
jgi:DNA-binding response OmpR family regulator